MALPVVLKSGKNYLTVVLDDTISFEELLSCIVNKFRESEKFFKDEHFAIMFEGRQLSDREKNIILDAIDEYTTIHITHLIENDQVKQFATEKALYDKENMIKDYKENNCLFIDHGVDMRQKIFGSGYVIIMGDVEKGAIIKAGGNIIVLGRLYGQALAGNNPDVKEPFIMANDFFPENFRIGSVLGDVPKRKKSVLKKHRQIPMMAKFTDGEIQINLL